MAAARLEGRLSFQRLGYRTQGDYAREELGKSARTLRRMACLGRRLVGLPRIRAAFESGELPLTKAECIARVATSGTERAWLRMAARLPIKRLQSAVRQAEEASGARDRGGNGFAAPGNGGSAERDESRSPMDVDVPGWMIGKAAAGMRLAGKVAGSSPPEGERWEYIAAEYLSGAPSGADMEDDGGPVDDQMTRESRGPADDAARVMPAADHRPRSPRSGRVQEPPVPGRAQETPSPGRIQEPPSPGRAQEPPAPSRAQEPQSPGRDDHLPARRDGGQQPEAPQEQQRSDDADALTPWQLHEVLKDAYAPAGAIDLELGGLLLAIRSRGCWRVLGFASFDDYVAERLDLSPRTARRLIRLRFVARRHRVLEAAIAKGVVSPLAATMLERVLELGLDPSAASAWIEYARRMPLQRLEDAIDWALSCAAVDPAWVRDHGRPPHPSFRFDSGVGGRCAGKRPKLAAAARSTLRLWLTRDERSVLERAVSVIRRARGPDWPLWACLNDLLDHFAQAYEDPAYCRLGARSPVLLRDDYQCQAPGCRARSGLHVHHILARGVGGPNTLDNLVVLCDFHHLAIHRGWIGCWGKAPDRIRWSFGVARGSMWFTDLSYVPRGECAPDWRRLPIAKFVGQYRLRSDEEFVEVERRLFGEVTSVRRPRGRSLTYSSSKTRGDRKRPYAA